MAQYLQPSRACLFAAALLLGLGRAAGALASDPLPGDDIAPPLNVNILMIYDEYQNDVRFAGQPGNPHGPDATQDTKLQANISVLRYLRSFDLGGFNAGAQIYVPYGAYLGAQRVGLNNLAAPAPGLPPLGRGNADLTKNSSFGQPSIGAYIFPIANRQSGTYFVIGPWIDPPISGFNKNYNLNVNQNVWTFESELAFRTVLLGTPNTPNLALEVWEENYFYLSNPHSAIASETIYADNLPPVYRLLGVSNPVEVTQGINARFREQPTTELHVYLPYEFYAKSHAYVVPGLYQSFGGKQTYLVNGLGVIDSGNRTEETQLRLVAASFVSPTLQVLLAGDYDIKAHGGPYDRTLEIRFVKFF